MFARKPNTIRSAAFFLIAYSCVGLAEAQDDERFYVGVGIGAADYSGSYESLTFSDTPATVYAYGGYRFSDQWSLEIAHLRLSTADSGTIAGSGTQHIRLMDRLESTSISAVRQIALSDAFDWKPSIVLFGMLGVNLSTKTADRLVVSTNQSSRTISDSGGVATGLGVLHRRNHFSLRGYLQWLDALDDDSVMNFGVAAEFGF